MRPLRTSITICICLGLLALALVGASAAAAEEPSWLCIPAKPGAPVTSGGAKGECEGTATAVEVPPPAEMKTLVEILPHVSYSAEGVGKQPTIQFSGVNLQIVNGTGTMKTTNGEGNLVLGYDEKSGEQTGSHNLVIGNGQEFTGIADIVAGKNNKMLGNWSAVLGGFNNTVSATTAAVVVGGQDNTASGEFAWVGGGYKNLAEGKYSSVFGGKELIAKENYEAIP